MQKLLFIDDDIDLLQSNKKYFVKSGYEVKTENEPKNAIRQVRSYNPDCIVLDVMMPGITGFDMIKKIREISDVPVIFLSGRTEENSKISGLMLGGNDYMIKPYSLKELSARIQAHIRVASAKKDNTRVVFAPLTFDLAAHKAYYNEDEIMLNNKEYDLLYLLPSAKGDVISFETIGKSIWGLYMESDRKNIMVTASRLRKKFEKYPELENMIETVWKKGYKFVSKRSD